MSVVEIRDFGSQDTPLHFLSLKFPLVPGGRLMSSDNSESESSEEKLWYVLKVQTNRERTIRDALLKKIRLEGLEEFFGEIMIPSEKVVDTRSDKAREHDRKLFPTES